MRIITPNLGEGKHDAVAFLGSGKEVNAVVEVAARRGFWDLTIHLDASIEAADNHRSNGHPERAAPGRQVPVPKSLLDRLATWRFLYPHVKQAYLVHDARVSSETIRRLLAGDLVVIGEASLERLEAVLSRLEASNGITPERRRQWDEWRHHELGQS